MNGAIDFYIEHIDGFESMSFAQRRDAVRDAKLDNRHHTKATLKGIFRVKPAQDAMSTQTYTNEFKQEVCLYTLSQCVNMREPSSKPRSEAQKKASALLGKKAHESTPQFQAVMACRALIDSGAILVDTETTDLDGVVIQIAAVCCKTKKILYSTLVHTDEEISKEAQRVHGISADMLVGAPKPDQVANELDAIIKDNKLAAFNAEFDKRVCQDTFKGASFISNKWFCVMYGAAVPVCGATNRYGTISLSNTMIELGLSWRGKAHDAAADCLAAVDVIHEIASIEC